MANPNIFLHGFKEGNQIGKLATGVPKLIISKETTYSRISNILEKITEEKILSKLEKIDDLQYLYFATKLLEMKMGYETKLAELEAKKEANKVDDTQDADIVSIKLIRKSDQDNTNNTIE